MLAGQGFEEVYNLAGGIKAWQGHVTGGPVEAGLEHISGHESPAEMLAIAFGMEDGMLSFYERLSEAVTEEEVSALFEELSGMEVEHKKAIFALYRAEGGELETIEALHERASRAVMEGGMDPEAILDAIQPRTRSIEDVLSYVMMLEAQGLDLYLRFAQRSGEEATRKVLLELADQEKEHLRRLGELMDTRAGGSG